MFKKKIVICNSTYRYLMDNAYKIDRLESRLKDVEVELDCKRGKHKPQLAYELVVPSLREDKSKPFVQCEHCRIKLPPQDIK